MVTNFGIIVQTQKKYETQKTELDNQIQSNNTQINKNTAEINDLQTADETERIEITERNEEVIKSEVEAEFQCKYDAASKTLEQELANAEKNYTNKCMEINSDYDLKENSIKTKYAEEINNLNDSFRFDDESVSNEDDVDGKIRQLEEKQNEEIKALKAEQAAKLKQAEQDEQNEIQQANQKYELSRQEIAQEIAAETSRRIADEKAKAEANAAELSKDNQNVNDKIQTLTDQNQDLAAKNATLEEQSSQIDSQIDELKKQQETLASEETTSPKSPKDNVTAGEIEDENSTPKLKKEDELKKEEKKAKTQALNEYKESLEKELGKDYKITKDKKTGTITAVAKDGSGRTIDVKMGINEKGQLDVVRTDNTNADEEVVTHNTHKINGDKKTSDLANHTTKDVTITNKKDNTVTKQRYGNDDKIDSEVKKETNEHGTTLTKTTYDNSGNIKHKNISNNDALGHITTTNEDYTVINGKSLISSKTLSVRNTNINEDYAPIVTKYSYDADGNKTGTQKISENGNRTETFDANDRITASTIINENERTENNYDYNENGTRRKITKKFKDNTDTPYSEEKVVYDDKNNIIASASHTLTENTEITVIKDGQTVQKTVKSKKDGFSIQTTFANDGETRLLEIYDNGKGDVRVQRYNEDGSTIAIAQPKNGQVNYKNNSVSAKDIASRYGLTEQQIVEANKGRKTFEAGEPLIIPNSVSITKFLEDASADNINNTISKAKKSHADYVAKFEATYGVAENIVKNAGGSIVGYYENKETTVWYNAYVGTSDDTQYKKVDNVVYGGVEGVSGRDVTLLARANVKINGKQQQLELAKIKGSENYVWCKFVENPKNPGHGSYELVGSAIKGVSTRQAVGSDYNGDGALSILNDAMRGYKISQDDIDKFNNSVKNGDQDAVGMAMVKGAKGYLASQNVVDDYVNNGKITIGQAIASSFMSDLTEENIKIFKNANSTMNGYTRQLYNLFTKDGIGYDYEEVKKKAEPILEEMKKLDASFNPENALKTMDKNRAKIAKTGDYVDAGISMSLTFIPVGGCVLSASYNATNNTLKGMDPGHVYLNFFSDAAFNKLGQGVGGAITKGASTIGNAVLREITDWGLNTAADAIQGVAQEGLSSLINNKNFDLGESVIKEASMAALTNTIFKGAEVATPYVSSAFRSVKSKLGFDVKDLDLSMSKQDVLSQSTTSTKSNTGLQKSKPDVTAQNKGWIQSLEDHRNASRGLNETEVVGLRNHIDNIDNLDDLNQLKKQLLGDDSNSKIFKVQIDEANERITHQEFLKNPNASTADIIAARQLIESSTKLSPTHKSDLLRQADNILGQRDYDAAVAMINSGYSRYEDNTAITDLIEGSKYLNESQKRELLSMDASSPNAEAVYNNLLDQISKVSQQGGSPIRDLNSGWNGTRTAYGQSLDGFDVQNGHQRYGYIFTAEGNYDLKKVYGLYGATPEAKAKFMDFEVSLSSKNLDKLQNIGQLGKKLGSDFQIDLQGLGAYMIEKGALGQAGIKASNARDYGLTNKDLITSRGIDAQAINEFTDLTGQSYNMRVNADGNPVRTSSNGWSEIDDVRNPNTGFHAKVYEKEGKVTIAFSGSDDVKDIVSDHQIVNGQMPDQIHDVQKLIQKVKAEHPDAQILVTGHSLGGGAAELAASLPGCEDITAVTFDAVGMKELVTSDAGIKLGLTDNNNSVNFVIKGDLISNAMEHTGITIITDKTDFKLDEHAIQQFSGEGNSLVGTQGGMTAINDAKLETLGIGTVKIKNPDGTVTKKTDNFTLSEQIELQGEYVFLTPEEFKYTQKKFKADVNNLNADLDALEKQISHLTKWEQRAELEKIIKDRRKALNTDFNIESHVDQSKTVAMTGNETNELLMKKYGFDQPAFPEGDTKNVRKLTLKSDATFVRVYCETGNPPSFAKGVWLMAADEIKGLTPAQIKDKFALPGMPSHVVEIKVDAGTEMISGACGKIEGWGNGGGTQYFLTGGKSHNYTNFRKLVNN